MYMNGRKMKTSSVTGIIQIVVGAIFVFFFVAGSVGVLAGDGENKGSTIGTVFFMIIPFALLLYFGIRKMKMRETARKLNQLFCADRDGVITAAELSAVISAKNEFQMIQKVATLIGKGYLINCTVERSPNLHIVLAQKETKEIKVEAFKCPNCGASIEKRSGFATTCPYCGSKVS